MPDTRSRAAGAIIGDTFYFLGGEATGGVRPLTCWKIQLPSGAWTPIADMPTNGVGLGGVSNVDAAVVGTDIYIPGGWTGAATLNTLKRYDSVANTWEVVATDPVPSTLHAYATVGHQGKVYVFCGATVSGVLATVGYVYDPAAAAGARWSTTAALPTGRQYPGAVAINGKIYVAGGITTLTTVQPQNVDVYDIATNTWSPLGANIGVGRGGPAFFVRDGQPYIVAGGWTTYLTSGEIYSAGAWAGSDPCLQGLRTIAHDGNDQFLVKAGGWNNAFSNLAEYFALDSCYPDCNQDGQLTVQDFGCFQTAFVAGNMYADCNEDNQLTVQDFGCFQTAFVAGCP